ncbi:mitochondrial fission ELM1 family protein [Amorphus orientalis]|uniref:Mitochondrial fission protein ELM1 n=1 Tax=Amorphus orientalis TaxID=649198 RepID=A0AAE3VLU0_9HYPH|nr:mitochondrial fission ELM1 family protein [Amorphus orientalis]MDQ0314110.1 mitochondrial fission protein ELM1 [Amorphus orientalis]
MTQPPETLVVVPSGKVGHEVQCLGVAEALGASAEIARIKLRRPWSWLAPHGPPQPDQRPLVHTNADLVLASGRQAIPLARAIARRKGPRPLVVAIQAPRADVGAFDLVWANSHDRLTGPNVIQTVTSPNRLTEARLAEAAAALRARLPDLSDPWTGVLVGGASGSYRFGLDDARSLGEALAAFSRRHGASLLITPSRRTGAENVAAIAAALSDTPHWIWQGDGENPLLGIYGAAEAFVVTCDSVNMLGEAAFTGKPVLAWPMPGGRRKFDRFHAALVSHGAMHWFDGSLPKASYAPMDATREIATAIRQKLAAPTA